MKYNKGLDSLRAFAAIAVIAYHWSHLLPFGWIGIQLFFVLSGYLITNSLLDSSSRSTEGFLSFYNVFFVRRLLRLAPLYFLFCGIWFFVWLITKRPPSFPDAAPYLFSYTLNIAAMFPDFEGVPLYAHLWSLGVEAQFYLFWPFVVYFTNRRNLFLILIVMVIVAPCLRWLTYNFFVQDFSGDLYRSAGPVYFSPVSYIDAFAFGGLLTYRSVVAAVGRGLVVLITSFTCVTAGGLVAFYGMRNGYLSIGSLGWPNYMPYFYQYVWGYSLLGSLFFSIIALVLLNPTSRMLNNRMFTYLGKVSYGLYVWHAPVVVFFMNFVVRKYVASELLNTILFFCALCVVVFVSHLSYQQFEVKFLNLKGRVRPVEGK